MKGLYNAGVLNSLLERTAVGSSDTVIEVLGLFELGSVHRDVNDRTAWALERRLSPEGKLCLIREGNRAVKERNFEKI